MGSINSMLGKSSASYKDLMSNAKGGYNMGEIVFKKGFFGGFSRINNHLGLKVKQNNVVPTAEQNRLTNVAVFKAIATKYGNGKYDDFLSRDLFREDGNFIEHRDIVCDKLRVLTNDGGNPYVAEAFKFLLLDGHLEAPLSRDEMRLLDSLLQKGAEGDKGNIKGNMKMLGDLKLMKRQEMAIDLTNKGDRTKAEGWISAYNVKKPNQNKLKTATGKATVNMSVATVKQSAALKRQEAHDQVLKFRGKFGTHLDKLNASDFTLHITSNNLGVQLDKFQCLFSYFFGDGKKCFGEDFTLFKGEGYTVQDFATNPDSTLNNWKDSNNGFYKLMAEVLRKAMDKKCILAKALDERIDDMAKLLSESIKNDKQEDVKIDRTLVAKSLAKGIFLLVYNKNNDDGRLEVKDVFTYEELVQLQQLHSIVGSDKIERSVVNNVNEVVQPKVENVKVKEITIDMIDRGNFKYKQFEFSETLLKSVNEVSKDLLKSGLDNSDFAEKLLNYTTKKEGSKKKKVIFYNTSVPQPVRLSITGVEVKVDNKGTKEYSIVFEDDKKTKSSLSPELFFGKHLLESLKRSCSILNGLSHPKDIEKFVSEFKTIFTLEDDNEVEDNKVEENNNKIEDNKVEDNKVEDNKIEDNKVEDNKGE